MSLIRFVLDAIQFATSDDAQKSAASVGRWWKGNTSKALNSKMIRAKVALESKTRLIDVRTEFEVALRSHDVSEHMLHQFRLCMSELSDNAFLHGCRRADDQIDILLRIGTATSELSVKQPVALPAEIVSLRSSSKQAWAARFQEMTEFGGLVNVYNSASELRVADRYTLVAVFENNPRMQVSLTDFEGRSAGALPDDRYLVVDLNGEIDALNGRSFREKFDDLKEVSLILDFTGVSLMTSSGVRELFQLKDDLFKRNVKIVLCGMNNRVAGMFKSAYLDSVFPILDRLEDATAFVTDEKS